MFKNKKILIIIIVSGSAFLLFLLLEITGCCLAGKSRSSWEAHLRNQKIKPNVLQKVIKTNQALKKKIARYSPKGVYVVIDTAKNILYIKQGTVNLRQAVVSCGTGNILNEPDGTRKWVFDTPRGEFVVQSKLKKPVWVKPDWAFIEEGKTIPKELKERLEAGVLGDYALGFGDGYFIHGTLYTRLLGRNVTHGCIRVGDEDLKALYKSVSVGTKLFIY